MCAILQKIKELPTALSALNGNAGGGFVQNLVTLSPVKDIWTKIVNDIGDEAVKTYVENLLPRARGAVEGAFTATYTHCIENPKDSKKVAGTVALAGVSIGLACALVPGVGSIVCGVAAATTSLGVGVWVGRRCYVALEGQCAAVQWGASLSIGLMTSSVAVAGLAGLLASLGPQFSYALGVGMAAVGVALGLAFPFAVQAFKNKQDQAEVIQAPEEALGIQEWIAKAAEKTSEVKEWIAETAEKASEVKERVVKTGTAYASQAAQTVSHNVSQVAQTVSQKLSAVPKHGLNWQHSSLALLTGGLLIGTACLSSQGVSAEALGSGVDLFHQPNAVAGLHIGTGFDLGLPLHNSSHKPLESVPETHAFKLVPEQQEVANKSYPIPVLDFSTSPHYAELD